MVPQLVGKALPGFEPPVELVLQPGERGERSVIENNPALQPLYPATQPHGKGDALAQGEDLCPLRVRHRAGETTTSTIPSKKCAGTSWQTRRTSDSKSERSSGRGKSSELRGRS